MSLHDDRLQATYRDALRVLEDLDLLAAYPTKRGEFAERFAVEFLARHPEPTSATDGERGADDFEIDALERYGHDAQRVVESATAGYGLRQVPDVDELAKAHRALGRFNERTRGRAGTRGIARSEIDLADALTAVLALLEGER